MRNLRDGSHIAEADPVAVASLAGFVLTFAMAAALRQRRTPVAAAADDDDDDEPAVARPGGGGATRRMTKGGVRSSSSSSSPSSSSLPRAIIAILAVVVAIVIGVRALRDRVRALGEPDLARVTARALRQVERLAPAPPRAAADPGSRCEGYDDLPLLGAYNAGVAGVPKSVALGDIDALVPANAGEDARNLFRQGLALRFGFNVDEARRNFIAAADAAADGPNGVGCAVCLWGIARSLMPDVNNYKTRRPARDAARAALAVARTIVEATIDANTAVMSDDRNDPNTAGTSPHAYSTDPKSLKKLRALVDSASAFFGDREASDADSEDAQLAAHERYLASLRAWTEKSSDDANDENPNLSLGEDADVLALLGEAAMNPTPWRYWRRDGSYANPDRDPRRKPEPRQVRGKSRSAEAPRDWTGAAAAAEAGTGTRRRREGEEGIEPGVDGGVDGDGGDSDDANDPGRVFGVEAEVEERKSEGAHTSEAMTALNGALRRVPGHLLAAHMLVHLTESLPPPRLRPAVDGEQGDQSEADDTDHLGQKGGIGKNDGGPDPRMNSFLTAALGETAADSLASQLARNAGVSPHLAHMAAHTYVRVGRWRDAAEMSKIAIKADEAFAANCVYPYGADHNVAMLVSAAAMARDFTTAGTYAMSPGLRHGAVDAHAGLTSGFYPASALVMYARFGEWERIRAAADNAELHRAPLSKAYVDANPQGTTNAERWTWRVAASPWGRAQWAYVLGLASTKDGVEPEYPTNDNDDLYPDESPDESPDTKTDNKTTESWREISGWEWIEHLRKLTIRKITDDSPDVQVPDLTARNVSSPFDHYSPFCPWKRLIASVMVETLQAAYVVKGEYTANKALMAKYHLQTAVKMYDKLPYFEPEHHYLPARQCLGEFYLRTGDWAGAFKQFARDLDEDHPQNPWSLRGLERAAARTFGNESACNEVFTP